MAGLKDYLNKRKKGKLYNQWIQESGLPPDEIPDELQKHPDQGETDEDEIASNEGISSTQRRGTIIIPLRYLFLMIILIAMLLVALAVITTLFLVSN